jgi:hypothetical protein
MRDIHPRTDVINGRWRATRGYAEALASKARA